MYLVLLPSANPQEFYMQITQNNNMSKSILVMDRSLHFLVGHCKVIMGGLQWIVVYVYSSSFDIEGIICIV
jgi:hypothetical protein